jgi:hypothetical protein
MPLTKGVKRRWKMINGQKETNRRASVRPGAARWFICMPKIPILVYFEGLGMEYFGMSYVQFLFLMPFGVFYGHLVYYVLVWYIFSKFGMFYEEKSGSPGAT